MVKDLILIIQATTVPRTVARAAPNSSSLGKPKRPSINKKLNKTLTTELVTLVRMAILVLPEPL